MATEDKGHTCSQCQAYIPEGTFFYLRAGAVCCSACAAKNPLPVKDQIHFRSEYTGTLCLAALFFIIAGFLMIGGWDAEKSRSSGGGTFYFTAALAVFCLGWFFLLLRQALLLLIEIAESMRRK